MLSRVQLAFSLLVLVIYSHVALGGTQDKKILDQFKATYTQASVTSVSASPIDGLYAVNIGSRIVYYAPKEDLLLFGEIVNSRGESLTQTALHDATLKTTLGLELLSVSEGERRVIEVTSPQCPFCFQYHKFMQQHEKPIERALIFDTRNNPLAAKQVAHVFCSKDPRLEIEKLFRQEVSELKSCEEGVKKMETHRELAQQLAVNATPTLIFEDGSRIVGFRKKQIRQKLDQIVQ